MLKIIDNPNTEIKDEIEQRLNEMKEIYGERYCPCALKRTKNTICPCLHFREQDYEGECHCGRYVKVDVKE